MSTYIRELELKPQSLDSFRTFVKNCVEQKAHLALIIAQIDPDGVACAKLMKTVFEYLGLEVAGIYYAGTVGHRQNHKIFDKFNLSGEITKIEEMPEGCLHMLIDSSKLPDTRLANTKFSLEHFVGFIDHHHTNGKVPDKSPRERFMWNAQSVAATTLAWILAKKLEVPIDETLATLAAIGIYTDSNRLASEFVKDEDVKAYAQAREQGQTELFSKCCNYRLTKRCRLILAEVLTNCEDIEEYQISHPSTHLTEEDGDDISIYADHLHKYEGSHTTIVWGLCGSEIRYSIRSNGEGGNVNDVLHRLFGKSTGGTKQGAGGGRFRLPEQIAPLEESSEKFIAFFGAHLLQKLTHHAGVTNAADGGAKKP